MNVLRERQRAGARRRTSIHRDGAVDAADLHARYLLDVEMGPEMRTSRIKQAISSTQLFIQRWLMNLEAATAPRRQRRARPHLGVDAQLPRVGGQPQGVPVSGELARARPARRQDAPVRTLREHAAAVRGHLRAGDRVAAALPGRPAGDQPVTVLAMYRETVGAADRHGPRRRPDAAPSASKYLLPAVDDRGRGRLVDAVGAARRDRRHRHVVVLRRRPAARTSPGCRSTTPSRRTTTQDGTGRRGRPADRVGAPAAVEPARGRRLVGAEEVDEQDHAHQGDQQGRADHLRAAARGRAAAQPA